MINIYIEPNKRQKIKKKTCCMSKSVFRICDALIKQLLTIKSNEKCTSYEATQLNFSNSLLKYFYFFIHMGFTYYCKCDI